MTDIHITDIPDEWVKAADEQELSLAEYGRRMIRAGRRQFGYDYEPETPTDLKTLRLDEDSSTDIDSQLQSWILANLSADEAIDIEELTDLLEDDLARLADELCDDGRAKYRRTQGGYLKIDE